MTRCVPQSRHTTSSARPPGRNWREPRASGERSQQTEATSTIAAATVLSPQELGLTACTAEGHSNREIAERLYLSPRTIGSHLYRIFPKLDITSRGQLASRLKED